MQFHLILIIHCRVLLNIYKFRKIVLENCFIINKNLRIFTPYVYFFFVNLIE